MRWADERHPWRRLSRARSSRSSPQPTMKMSRSSTVGSVEVPVQFAVEQVDHDELALAGAFAAGRTVVTPRVIIAIALELATAGRAAQSHIVVCHSSPLAAVPVDLRPTTDCAAAVSPSMSRVVPLGNTIQGVRCL